MADYSSRRLFTPLDELEIDNFPGYLGRRRKAAFTLALLWGGTVALHLLSWGSWLVLGLMGVLTIHAVRILLARPLLPPAPLGPSQPQESSVPADGSTRWPFVSMLVAAKNEELVISRLVANLCSVD